MLSWSVASSCAATSCSTSLSSPLVVNLFDSVRFSHDIGFLAGNAPGEVSPRLNGHEFFLGFFSERKKKSSSSTNCLWAGVGSQQLLPPVVVNPFAPTSVTHSFGGVGKTFSSHFSPQEGPVDGWNLVITFSDPFVSRNCNATVAAFAGQQTQPTDHDEPSIWRTEAERAASATGSSDERTLTLLICHILVLLVLACLCIFKWWCRRRIQKGIHHASASAIVLASYNAESDTSAAQQDAAQQKPSFLVHLQQQDAPPHLLDFFQHLQPAQWLARVLWLPEQGLLEELQLHSTDLRLLVQEATSFAVPISHQLQIKELLSPNGPTPLLLQDIHELAKAVQPVPLLGVALQALGIRGASQLRLVARNLGTTALAQSLNIHPQLLWQVLKRFRHPQTPTEPDSPRWQGQRVPTEWLVGWREPELRQLEAKLTPADLVSLSVADLQHLTGVRPLPARRLLQLVQQHCVPFLERREVLTPSASFAEGDIKVTKSSAGVAGSLSFAIWASLPSLVQAESPLNVTEPVSNLINGINTVVSEAAAASNATAAATAELAFGSLNYLLAWSRWCLELAPSIIKGGWSGITSVWRTVRSIDVADPAVWLLAAAFVLLLLLIHRVVRRLPLQVWWQWVYQHRLTQAILRPATWLTTTIAILFIAGENVGTPQRATLETPWKSAGNVTAQTPIEARRLLWSDNTAAATPSVQATEVQWNSLDFASQRLWQGGQQPRPRGAADDRSAQAQEKRVDELWHSAVGKGKRLSEITPNPGSAEVPVPTVLQLLNTLEAMREAVVSYAHGANSITLGEMQHLLHSLLRRQAGPKWITLVELVQQTPTVRWADVTKRACGKLNVQSREEWETVLTAFSRTSGQRELTLGEFIFRFRILAQASTFQGSAHDSAYLYELLLRGAQTPGLVQWAQARARREAVANSIDSYASLTQGFQYVADWELLSQDERDEAIKLEAQLSDKALTHLFKCLRGHSQPNIGFLWPKDMRELAYQALENGLRASVKDRIETASLTLLNHGGKSGAKQGKNGAKSKKDHKDKKARDEMPEPLVPGALAAVKNPPTIQELRSWSDCWTCGRTFRDCRGGGKDQRGASSCQHADAKKLRRNLCAFARYPDIFAPTLEGARKWPQLSAEEKKALKTFIQRVGGDSKHLEQATLLVVTEPAQQPWSDKWVEELMALVTSDDAEPRYPAWIDRCLIEGVEIKPFLDTGGGASFITSSLAKRLQLKCEPAEAGLKLGNNCPIRSHGLVTVTLWSEVAEREFNIPGVAVVDDGVLTHEHQLLLGVAALERMACVPDVSAGKLFWKAESTQAAAQADRQQPLHTTRRPRDLQQESLPVYVATCASIPPGGKQRVQCYLITENGGEPEEELVLVKPVVDGSAAVRELALIGSPLPIDPNPTLQSLQRLAISLEIANFGEEALVFRVNDLIAKTERVSPYAQIRRRALRQEVEEATAVRVLESLQQLTRTLAHADVQLPADTRLASAVQSILDLLSIATEAGPLPSAVATEPAPEASEADAVEHLLLPETVPEVQVLEEAAATLAAILRRTDLDNDGKLQLMLLLCRHLPVFRYVLRPAEQLLTEPARINIPSDVKPRFVRQYPQPQAKVAAAEAIALDLLKQQVVEPTTSPWNSPVLLVPKKDGTWRFAIDYRRINAVTLMDPTAVPHAQQSLAQLGGNCFFTSCDLLSAFWQQPLHPDDRQVTAFQIQGLGQLQWCVMPMGMRNSSQTQQRIMEQLLIGLDPRRVLCYIDDLIIASPTFKEHLELLDLVFRRLEAVGMVLKLSKCTFAQPRVHFLGHIVDANGLQRDPALVNKILDLPTPTSLEGLRSFLGAASYYRDFIPNFSELTWPLTELASPKKLFNWTDACQAAFDMTKKAMASPQVLALPDWSRQFILATDASNVGLGAVLMQQLQDDAAPRPITFISRKLKPAECNYSTTEREALAVIEAVNKLRYYLLGLEQPFLILTDHSALVHLLNPDPPASSDELGIPHRIRRWRLTLSSYNYRIQHLPGKRMVVPDFLSRFADGDLKEVQAYFERPWPGLTAAVPAQDAVMNLPNFQLEAIDTTFLVDLQVTDPILEALRVAAAGNLEAAERKLLAIYNAERPAERPLTTRPSRWRGIGDLQQFRLSKKDVLVRIDTSDEDERLLLVVPQQLRRLLLEEKHEASHAAHTGVKRTMARLSQRYWWPGMSHDVEVFVGSCLKCLQSKPHRGRWTQGLLQPLPLVFRPFERLSIDILTIHQDNPRFKHALVMIDHSTRFLELRPLRSKRAEEVAQQLYSAVFERYGPVSVLLSDQGGEFDSAVTTALCRAFGTLQVRTSTHHLETNGLTERTNSTILAYLRALTEEDTSNWFQYLGAAQYAYNTAYQTSLCATPYFLMHGRDPVDAVDQVLEELSGVQAQPPPDVQRWLERLDKARFAAQQHLFAAQLSNKEQVDRNRREASEIVVGAWVYLRLREERKQKLEAFGQGVFQVLERQGNRVRLGGENGSERWANIADVVLLRSPPKGKDVFDAYQRTRLLLHKELTKEELAAEQRWDAQVQEEAPLPPEEEALMEEETLQEEELLKHAQDQANAQEDERLRGVMEDLLGSVEDLVAKPMATEERVSKEVLSKGKEEWAPSVEPSTTVARVDQPSKRVLRSQQKDRTEPKIVGAAIQQQQLQVQVRRPKVGTTWHDFVELDDARKWDWLRDFRDHSGSAHLDYPEVRKLVEGFLAQDYTVPSSSETSTLVVLTGGDCGAGTSVPDSLDWNNLNSRESV